MENNINVCSKCGKTMTEDFPCSCKERANKRKKNIFNNIIEPILGVILFFLLLQPSIYLSAILLWCIGYISFSITGNENDFLIVWFSLLIFPVIDVFLVIFLLKIGNVIKKWWQKI